MQQLCLGHLERSYVTVGACPADLRPRGSFRELCGSAVMYGETSTTVVPYDKDLVSWPALGAVPVDLASALSAEHTSWLRDLTANMRRPPAAAAALRSELGLRQPYVDPAFRHQRVYADFIKGMLERGMVRLVPTQAEATVGLFFVKKKSGRQRIIFDTRLANCDFEPPPSTHLPSASAFSKMETSECDVVWYSVGDVENAFYAISVPPELGACFRLPPIRAGLVGRPVIGGSRPGAAASLTPILTVLPMGWSWALHLCQLVTEEGLSRGGLSADVLVKDRAAPQPLGPSRPLGAAGYVDNFLVQGAPRDRVTAAGRRVTAGLEEQGFSVHEDTAEAVDRTDFVGLAFDGRARAVRVSTRRMWWVRLAIEELLSQGRCSGDMLEVILGHVTWLMLLQRSTLSILSSVYAFVKANKQQIAPLWDSVAHELKLVRDLLPLFVAHTDSKWLPTVTASDASPWGCGVCVRDADPELVGRWGAHRGEVALQAGSGRRQEPRL